MIIIIIIVIIIIMLEGCNGNLASMWLDFYGRVAPIFEKNILTIFRKYFENVQKIIFLIFWHFYTREAGLARGPEKGGAKIARPNIEEDQTY